jgi:hypothetical protein
MKQKMENSAVSSFQEEDEVGESIRDQEIAVAPTEREITSNSYFLWFTDR